ncbi:LysR family transcriptional regulator [Cognatishimia sp. WU-CL00825]|uniref:LysR family transcriptional regulator n=1 Tax=Cognatishimia sp. WU-CL00825 TaxID=3127658 RepID=UPI00310C2397
MHNDNWDDIRFVLAVVESGTVSGAARRLGVNHATVLRRIASFEERYGVRIFDKSAQGYEIIPEYARITDALRGVEESMHFMEAALAGQNSQVQGALRLTSTDSLSSIVLPEVVANITADFPELRLTVISTNSHLDLGRAQVDLAIRPTDQLPETYSGDLVGYLPFAIYEAEGGQDAWVGLTGQIARGTVGQEVTAHIAGQKIAAKADTYLVAARLARQGIGRTALPCFVGDVESGLRRVDIDCALPSIPLWVACHTELQDAPRVRRLRARMVDEMKTAAIKTKGLLPA